MDAHHLSNRLLKVANYVPRNARLADIGSDHAYLPAYLALNHQINFAIAGEVVRGPYLNAVNEVKKENLEDKIFPRLADGLDAIKFSDQVDTITICGMGGMLIKEILEKGQKIIETHPLLILQPNVSSDILRAWLNSHQYEILNEEILSEDGHIYEIIVARYTPKLLVKLSEKDLMFGQYLRHHQNAAFKEKWEKEIQKNQKAISQMQKANHVPKNRISQLQQENDYIEGVLKDGKSN